MQYAPEGSALKAWMTGQVRAGKAKEAYQRLWSIAQQCQKASAGVGTALEQFYTKEYMKNVEPADKTAYIGKTRHKSIHCSNTCASRHKGLTVNVLPTPPVPHPSSHCLHLQLEPVRIRASATHMMHGPRGGLVQAVCPRTVNVST